ncbi:MAG: 50S ribosomal protein L6 [Candidatus Micrarchaeia archaeon]
MAVELEIGEGTKVELLGGDNIKISGKLGSTTKHFNSKLLSVSVSGSKLAIDISKNKKLAKKATLAQTALASELRAAMKGVNEGVTRHMRVVFAHFPISFEIKGNVLYAKNVFGEHLPRTAKIVGDTKVEIKGQEVFVKGVDPYDVNQTAANLFALSFLKQKDERIFQDGIYHVKEE